MGCDLKFRGMGASWMSGSEAIRDYPIVTFFLRLHRWLGSEYTEMAIASRGWSEV